MDKVDSRDESQHVELEAFVAAGDDAEQASKRSLVARAARSVREDRAGRKVILADGSGRERDAQLRNRPAAGVDDIYISNEVIDRAKLARVARLATRVRLAIAVAPPG